MFPALAVAVSVLLVTLRKVSGILLPALGSEVKQGSGVGGLRVGLMMEA